MAQMVFPAAERQILEQIVAEPRFRAITLAPGVGVAGLGVLAGAYLLFAAAAWLWLRGVLPYWAALTLAVYAMYAAFTPYHDASHGSASANRFLNGAIGNAAALLLFPGLATGTFRFVHLQHHRHTGAGAGAADPDHAIISAPPLLRLLLWAGLDACYFIWYFRRRRSRPAGEQAVYWGGLAYCGCWHALWLISPYAREFLLLWLAPQRLGLIVVVYLFAYIQHPRGVLQAERPLQATRMIRGGWPLRVLMLGHSEHLVHHLFPQVPFYRYHRAWLAGRVLLEGQPLAWQWPLAPPAPLPADAPAPAARLLARIGRVREVAPQVRAYELVSAEGGALPPFSAGAHVDVLVAPGITRQYSLCGAPGESGRYLIAVKLEQDGRGGSRRIHETFAAGQVIGIGAPRNHFALNQKAAVYCLVGGGIGVAPLLAMAHALHARAAAFTLHLCARNGAALPFAAELAALPFARHLRVHLDDGPQAQQFRAADIPRWQPGYEMYLCGPRPFMSLVIGSAHARGWPDRAVRTESFAPRLPGAGRNTPFTVFLARSGGYLYVPADKSLLEVLQAAKKPVAGSCTQGLCGTCMVKVLEGRVDHRDALLSDAEKASDARMTSCVSRALGRHLVVDL